MRMEPLETRQMLSTSQAPEVEFDDPIIIVSGPGAPTSDSELSSTSVTDVYGTQGIVLQRQSYCCSRSSAPTAAPPISLWCAPSKTRQAPREPS